MNTFVNAVKEDMTHTYTENGALAKNTSGDACLDFFSTAGSLRSSDADRKIQLFNRAYREDPLSALRILFYVRDVRGGLGERETFRTILKNVAEKHPEELRKNIYAIPWFGRWDDCYSLIGTPCEASMWSMLKEQIISDIKQMNLNHPVSLLAKWIKSGNESSKKSRTLGIKTALNLGYSVYEFKRIIAKLRKYLDVVESKMSTNRWDEITYSHVPSRAGMIYRNAFNKHDGDRYQEFISAVNSGEEKINTSTLYPYDIIEKVYHSYKIASLEDKQTLCTLWDNLPDYVGNSYNAMVIADTSGSMMCDNGRPFFSAIALAVYFAQRNRGAYHNLWMSFSNKPKYHELEGDDIFEIVKNFDTSDWAMNTNLEKALKMILNTAIENNVPKDDIPKSLIIISDMEIDYATGSNWSFYDYMKKFYNEHDYEIPNIVFWNVNSRHNIFHADSKRKGVQLVSGQSAATFKTLMSSIGMTPMEYMYSVINSERYSMINI